MFFISISAMMPMDIEKIYLERNTIHASMHRISLNAGWQFVKLPKGIPVEREDLDWEKVSLPHT